MISLIIATLLQAAGHLPPTDVVGDRAKDVAQVYWDCAIERAERFELSGESADDIAQAAITICDTLDDELIAAIVVYRMSNSNSEESLAEPIDARAIVSNFRSKLLVRAKLRVVQIRTRRALSEPGYESQ